MHQASKSKPPGRAPHPTLYPEFYLTDPRATLIGLNRMNRIISWFICGELWISLWCVHCLLLVRVLHNKATFVFITSLVSRTRLFCCPWTQHSVSLCLWFSEFRVCQQECFVRTHSANTQLQCVCVISEMIWIKAPFLHLLIDLRSCCCSELWNTEEENSERAWRTSPDTKRKQDREPETSILQRFTAVLLKIL